MCSKQAREIYFESEKEWRGDKTSLFNTFSTTYINTFSLTLLFP